MFEFKINNKNHVEYINIVVWIYGLKRTKIAYAETRNGIFKKNTFPIEWKFTKDVGGLNK